jgi:hypothetical protein
MQQHIRLSIPKPCSEKWENFTPTLHGGYCSACNKTVLDFTTASDDEIHAFFKNRPAHACGRFHPEQLKQYSAAAALKINPGFALLKAGLTGLVLLLLNRPAVAQSIPAKSTVEIVDQSNRSIVRDSVREGAFMVKGIVLAAEDDTELPGVNIVLKGTDIGTATDAGGFFEFPKKLNVGDVLIFSFIGLSSEEYRIKKTDGDGYAIDIGMKLELDITGEVAVEEIYAPRPSIFNRMWLKVKSVF